MTCNYDFNSKDPKWRLNWPIEYKTKTYKEKPYLLHFKAHFKSKFFLNIKIQSVKCHRTKNYKFDVFLVLKPLYHPRQTKLKQFARTFHKTNSLENSELSIVGYILLEIKYIFLFRILLPGKTCSTINSIPLKSFPRHCFSVVVLYTLILQYTFMNVYIHIVCLLQYIYTYTVVYLHELVQHTVHKNKLSQIVSTI